ncbi:MAG: hypothetical protein II132_09600 [Desulfovibrio sp.]|nr:hypothetical protein [Desulfovibrio sp.]
MARKPDPIPRRTSRSRRAQSPGFGAPPASPLPEDLPGDAVEVFTADGRLLALGREEDWQGQDRAVHASACLGFGWNGDILVAVDAGGMADFAGFALRRPGESSLEALERGAPELCRNAFALRPQGLLEPSAATGRRWIAIWACDLPEAFLNGPGLRGHWAVVSPAWLEAAARGAMQAEAAAQAPASMPVQAQEKPRRGRPRKPPRGRPGRKPLSRPKAAGQGEGAGIADSLIHAVSPRLALAVASGALRLRAVRVRQDGAGESPADRAGLRTPAAPRPARAADLAELTAEVADLAEGKA